MSEEKKSGSADAGSLGNVVDPNNIGGDAGQSTQNKTAGDGATNKMSEDVVPKSQYQELEKKLGEQSAEVHEARKIKEEKDKLQDFLNDVSPLMEKLDADPNLVKAIMEGKIDSNLIQAAVEGKVSIKDATDVTKAHDEVKKDMGDKKYDQATPEEIEKKISEKLESVRGEIEKKFSKELSDDRQIREYETKISSFINRTPDFAEYAGAIDKFAKEHPDIADVEVMYKAVKADKLMAEAEQKKAEDAKEKEKELAANAGGGASHSKSAIKDNDLVNKLFGNMSDPNRF